MTFARVQPLFILLTVTAMLLGAPQTAQPEVIRASEATVRSDEKVQAQVEEKVAERRKAMLEDAHAALDETNAALRSLDEGNTEDALDELARATGKLELLVARDPSLKLAPVDVNIVTHDLYATPEAIRAARSRAEDLLEDGKVQEARVLLSGLASEIVVNVTSLPLATYPDAIKAISPLIDEGKIEEAEAQLRAALNTLVVTEEAVISLPVLRAQEMLDEAEELVKKEAPTEEEKKKIGDLVDGARDQLEMARLLGYGNAADHSRFDAQIANLKKKIGAEEETKGVFATLRQSLDAFQTKYFN